MGSSTSISASTSNPRSGEKVIFSCSYEYDKKEDDEVRCSSKNSINFGVKNVSAQANIKVKYLVKGGTFTSGTKVAELGYELLNPMESFRVNSRVVEIGQAIVACIATEDGSTTIASEKITIVDPQNKAADIKLWFDGMSTEQRIHVVRPNLALTLRARGTILNSDDEVLVLSKGELFRSPTLTALQMPARRYPLGDQGIVTLNFTEEGGAAPPTAPSPSANLTAPTRMLPPPPAPISTTSSSAGSGAACVICQDVTVSVLFHPCRHVCVCDGCATELRNARSRMCPICRHEITREEKECGPTHWPEVPHSGPKVPQLQGRRGVTRATWSRVLHW
eukprot:gene27379-36146_t